MNFLVLFIGGGLGTVCRYLTYQLYNRLEFVFPFGTLTVNVLGSFLIGFLSVLILGKFHLSQIYQSLILTGFLGGYTTFSSFNLDILTLIHEGHIIRAIVYILLSFSLGLIAITAGYLLAKAL